MYVFIGMYMYMVIICVHYTSSCRMDNANDHIFMYVCMYVCMYAYHVAVADSAAAFEEGGVQQHGDVGLHVLEESGK